MAGFRAHRSSSLTPACARGRRGPAARRPQGGTFMTPLLIASFCIVAFAAAAQTTTGFGFALVGVPLLTLAADPQTAVVTITTVNLVLVVMMAIRERAHIEWRSAAVVAGTSLFGIPVGLYVLATFAERPLTVIIAFVVLAFTVFLAIGRQIGRSTRNEAAIGVSSGVLLGATGMNGPPLVAAFQAMRLSPRAFRATLQAVFAVQSVILVVGFVLTHQYTEQNLTISLTAAPAVLVGWLIGEKIFHRLAGHQFRRLVLITMSLSAVLAFINTFM